MSKSAPRQSWGSWNTRCEGNDLFLQHMTDTADVNYEHTSSNNFVENFIDDNTNRSCVDIVRVYWYTVAQK